MRESKRKLASTLLGRGQGRKETVASVMDPLLHIPVLLVKGNSVLIVL